MKVETCCGCCSLRTGTIIIGILGIIGAIGGIITYSIALGKIHDDNLKLQTKISIGSLCISLALKALLLFGAFKQSRYFLLPWLIMTAIGLVLSILAAIVILILAFAAVHIVLLIICVLMWYPWICVLSYYKELSLAANALPMNPAVYHDGRQYAAAPPAGVTYVTQQPPTYTDYQKGPQAV